VSVIDNLFRRSPAERVYIVAQGNGGAACITALAAHYELFKQRVMLAALLDSGHSIDTLRTHAQRIWVRERCINWMISDDTPGVEIKDLRFGCRCLVSGK
jgi:hypothetical protein